MHRIHNLFIFGLSYIEVLIQYVQVIWFMCFIWRDISPTSCTSCPLPSNDPGGYFARDIHNVKYLQRDNSISPKCLASSVHVALGCPVIPYHANQSELTSQGLSMWEFVDEVFDIHTMHVFNVNCGTLIRNRSVYIICLSLGVTTCIALCHLCCCMSWHAAVFNVHCRRTLLSRGWDSDRARHFRPRVGGPIPPKREELPRNRRASGMKRGCQPATRAPPHLA